MIQMKDFKEKGIVTYMIKWKAAKLKRSLGIRWKLVIVMTTLITIVTAVVVWSASSVMKEQTGKFMEQQLKSEIGILKSGVEELYFGDWNIQNDQLYKGSMLINGNRNLVNEIAAKMNNNITVSFYVFDKLAVTSLKTPYGQNTSGKKIDAAIVEQTLKAGQPSLGSDGEYRSMYVPLRSASNEVIGMFSIAISESYVIAMFKEFYRKILSIGFLVLFVSAGIVWFLAGRATFNLLRITALARDLAAGNLGVKQLNMHTTDEIGQLASAIDQMVLQWRSLIGGLNEAAMEVAASAQTLSDGSEQSLLDTLHMVQEMREISLGAEQQAAGASESSNAMEEIAIGVQRIAETSSIVSEASIDMLRQSEKGEKDVFHTVEQFQVLANSVAQVTVAVEGLTKRSNEIRSMAGAISEISSQTNLLALNAAIESARAGEHGRGFAVVANEVRKLAAQSEDSAGEIRQVIADIQKSISEVITALSCGEAEMNKGKKAVNEVGNSFRVILSAARQVNDQIQEVSAAAQQMSAGTEEVTAAIAEISRISKQSASKIEEAEAVSQRQSNAIKGMSTSAVSLSEMAQRLQEYVGKFSLL